MKHSLFYGAKTLWRTNAKGFYICGKNDNLTLKMKEFLRHFVPGFMLSFYHFLWAFLGAFLYGFPSRRLVVIGVTGTNGKSTVVELCELVLREAGYRVASSSSIRFKIGDKEWRNELKMTMPGRFQLQKFLRQAVNAGCQYAVLEVTSEGIKQHRHRFIDFDVAVLTNLTPEHIEAHGGFEKYREAKGELFKALKSEIRNPKSETNPKSQNKKISIINLDDPNAEYFLQFPADEKYGFAVQDSRFKMKDLSVIKAENVRFLADGVRFRARNIEKYLDKYLDLNLDISLPLLGEFNVYNALAAICVGLSQGIKPEIIKKALERVKDVPGRMEVVVRKPFTVIVDYAHTPDALRKVYEVVYSSKFIVHRNNSQLPTPNSQLICVLGAAGGGRDKWKRPEMGKIAAQYCDQIILTNEDPYDENPAQIIDDIEAGFSQILNVKSKILNHEKILDRREAIRKALSLAKAGDVVIITGKGCEPWMCVAHGEKIPWDDRKVIGEEMKTL